MTNAAPAFLRETAAAIVCRLQGAGFEAFWRESLQRGTVDGSAAPALPLDPSAVAVVVTEAAPPPEGSAVKDLARTTKMPGSVTTLVVRIMSSILYWVFRTMGLMGTCGVQVITLVYPSAFEPVKEALREIDVTGDQRVGTFMWNNAEHLTAYLAVPGTAR